MSNPLTILVTGATGKQGGAVARELLARGHNVRALTRDPQSEPARTLATDGATVVAGDYEEPSAVESAGRGADAVFVVATPYEASPEAEKRQATNAIEALRRAEVGHIVYTSVASADQKTRIPHFDSKRMVEERLQQLDGDYTIVGPVYFMENLLAPWTLPQLREGRHAAALPAGRPLQQIAVADVALFSVIVLERGRDFAGKRIDIASDELTGAEVVKVLSETTGLPFEYAELPLDGVRAQNEDLARTFEWFDGVGYSADIDGLRRDYPEVGWHRFPDWAREQDWAAVGVKSAGPTGGP